MKTTFKSKEKVTLLPNAVYSDGTAVSEANSRKTFVIEKIESDQVIISSDSKPLPKPIPIGFLVKANPKPNEIGKKPKDTTVNIILPVHDPEPIIEEDLDPITEEEAEGYNIKILASAINIRSGPGTNHPIVKTLFNDQNIYRIVEEENGINVLNSTSIPWGKIKNFGWIALQYTKKV